jgi:DNA polymerase
MKLQIEKLKPAIKKLHNKYGDKNYSILYGTGCIKNPKVMFLFMNPTARNLSTHKKWKGIRASWIGHKNTWQLFCDVEVFDKKLNDKIQSSNKADWTPELAEEIYKNIAKNKAYVTGLARCTQPDARHVPDIVFRESREITLEEIKMVNPKYIIAFGNQVSSNLLKQLIKVSECRCKRYDLIIGNKSYPVYPTFYPVGMGLRNIKKAIEDIKKILSN